MLFLKSKTRFIVAQCLIRFGTLLLHINFMPTHDFLVCKIQQRFGRREALTAVPVGKKVLPAFLLAAWISLSAQNHKKEKISQGEFAPISLSEIKTFFISCLIIFCEESLKSVTKTFNEITNICQTALKRRVTNFLRERLPSAAVFGKLVNTSVFENFWKLPLQKNSDLPVSEGWEMVLELVAKFSQ